MSEMDKTIAVVTGSASGIGKAIAESFLKSGAVVIGMDRNLTGGGFTELICDVGSEDDVSRSFDVIRNTYGHIHYLINCAGIYMGKQRDYLENTDRDTWMEVLQTNLTGTMQVIREAIPLMRSAAGDRAIVNISSDQAFFPREKNCAYAVSKMGINGLTQIAARELLADGIRVNGVAPASVQTNFIRQLSGSEDRMKEIYQRENEKMPFGLIQPEDVAELVQFLCCERAKKITGQIIVIDSGLYSKRG